MRRVAVVTGATGVFGRHIAIGLLRAGFLVVCVGRNAARLRQLAEDLRAVVPGSPVDTAVVDPSSLKSVRAFARAWPHGALDVLVNNAAATPRVREQADRNIEMQWACNVLGYHWMLRELLPFLRKASHPRVTNVSSFYAGGLNLRDVEFRRRPYDAHAAYRASKQANRQMTRGWAERLGPGFVVTSCHPGLATSAVSLGLGIDADRSAWGQVRGSLTPLFCVLDPRAESGGFYASERPAFCSFSAATEQTAQLMALLDSYG